MAEEEDGGDGSRKVKIIWEVDDRTKEGLESVASRQRAAAMKLATSAAGITGGGPGGRGGAVGNFANPQQAADGMKKLGDAADKAGNKISKVKDGVDNAAVGVKRLAEQGQAAIGKFTGIAGAAVLAASAIGLVADAIIKVANADKAAEEKRRDAVMSRVRMEMEQAEKDRRYEEELAAMRAEGNKKNLEARKRTNDREAVALERKAELMAVEGRSQRDINKELLKALDIRLRFKDLTAEEVSQLKHQKRLLEARPGGGSGPSAAERVRAEGEGRIQQLRDELTMAEQLAELNGTTGRDAAALATKRRDLKLAELGLERQVLDATKARNSVERAELANKKAGADRKGELIDIESRIAARRIETAERERATAAAVAQQTAESQMAAKVISLDSARAKLQLEAAGRTVALTDKRKDLLAVEQAGLRVHQLTIAQLGQEAAAAQRLLDIREAEVRARESAIPGIQHQADIEQVAHDRKLAMMDAEVAAMQAADAEKARLMANEQARIQHTTGQISTAIGTFEQIQGSFESVVGDYANRFKAQQDQELADWRSNLEARTQSQAASLDKQIQQAQGNSSLQRHLTQRKAALEKSTQKQIEQAEAQHNARRQRGEMRFQGMMLLIQGAVQVAKAAAAYPVVPSMIAHGIAAGLNFAYGAMLMAGKVPGAGGGGVGAGGGGGGSGTAPSSADRGSAEINRIPESRPGGRAAERQGTRGRTVGGGGGSVTFNGNVTINALGSVDEDAATKIGMAVNQGKHIREGAGTK